MRLRKVMILLVAGTCIGPGLRGCRPEPLDSLGISPLTGAVLETARACFLRPCPQSSLFRPLSSRHRIKSVLPEKDARAFEALDVGPAVISGHFSVARRDATVVPRPLPPIPLRC